jgi:hypothetical protein
VLSRRQLVLVAFAVCLGDVAADGGEELAELCVLSLTQAGEERVFDGSLCGGGGVKKRGARRGDRDDVSSAIGGVAVACDVAVGLEGVQEGHQDAVVDAEDVAQLALADWPAIFEEVERLELARLEAVVGESAAQLAHGVVTEERQGHQGALVQLPEGLAGTRRRCGAGGHAANNVARYIVQYAIRLVLRNYVGCGTTGAEPKELK